MKPVLAGLLLSLSIFTVVHADEYERHRHERQYEREDRPDRYEYRENRAERPHDRRSSVRHDSNERGEHERRW